MRILLLGEFSGVNTAISEYLRSLNFEVSFLAEKDGWKDFRGESFFYKYSRLKVSKLLNFFYVIINLKKLRGFEYVLFLTPNFPGKLYFITGIYHYIFNRNRIIIYYACGTDIGFVNEQNNMDYSAYGSEGLEKPKYNLLDKILFKYFIENVDRIYSSSPDYSFYYRKRINYFGHKHLPLYDFKIPDSKLINLWSDRDSLKVFHPISRPEFKGTKYILDALNAFMYIENVEIIVAERLPFVDLLEHLVSCDVLIDQCLGYGFGILATLGMKCECIVLTGFRDENSCVFHPGIYNIDPDVEQIIGVIDNLSRLGKEDIEILKLHAKKYIEIMEENNIKYIFN